MATYKTPDVYIEEISLFPPSVAEVETAIPAFIGYTEKALKNGVENLKLVPTRITSMAEYEESFGYGPPVSIEEINLSQTNSVTSTIIESTFYMYDALRLFYNNGGGKCYIISIGQYPAAASVKLDDFTKGLDVLKKKDEPTLILFPDGVLLKDDLYTLQALALKQANDLQDRFVVCDLLESQDVEWIDGVDAFRDKVGINNLKYGAAYTPWLKTNLSKTVRYSDVVGVMKKNNSPTTLEALTTEPLIIQTIKNLDDALNDNDVINGGISTDGSISNYLSGLSSSFGLDFKPETLQAGYNTLAVAFKAKANTELAKLTDLVFSNAVKNSEIAKANALEAQTLTAPLTNGSLASVKDTVITALITVAENIISIAGDIAANSAGQEAIVTEANGVVTNAGLTKDDLDDYKSHLDTTLASDISTSANELVGEANALCDAAVKSLQGNLKVDDVVTEFKKLFEFIYKAAYQLINDWASGTKLKVNNAAVTALDTVKNYINSPLKAELAKLNSYINSPEDYISGADWDTLYNSYSWDTTVWGDTFTNILTLDILETSIYADRVTPLNNQKFIENMKGAENFILAAFNQLNTVVYGIAEAAKTYITNFEAALIVQFPLYKNILDKISSELTIIPPSGAVVGVYAAVDSTRGVWKAPANVSLNSVLGLTETIDSKEQENLNVDVDAGKSINAIRAFTGKGILIWGARTLAGNDNEWRYISVRRFFNMVEESVKKSTYWAVFEPNDANTWIKVKAMIENYLTLKWKDGALAGAKPDQAFYVKVGLGVTMTAQDILEGRMNVEIGMAVVRPAEFIILKFSHKMQES